MLYQLIFAPVRGEGRGRVRVPLEIFPDVRTTTHQHFIVIGISGIGAQTVKQIKEVRIHFYNHKEYFDKDI